MRKEFFGKFLKHFWLRPENAILLSLRAEKYWSTLEYFGDGRSSIDVSCGDGVFSFITLGGDIGDNSDMFRSVNVSQTYRKGNFDVFDFNDGTYSIDISKAPISVYEYGSDWKNNLLMKADKLKFYNRLFQHDNNFPLPIASSSMEYVYSNSAYWVENFEGHLNDLARITKEKGHIVLQIKTDNILKLTSANYAPFMGDKFHQIVDAGRLSTWKGLKSKDELIKLLSSNKEIQIKRIEPIYGDILAIIWDVGLRPLFSPLVKMANSLPEEKRIEIKKEWCEIIFGMFDKFIDNYIPNENSAIEFLIVLEKR